VELSSTLRAIFGGGEAAGDAGGEVDFDFGVDFEGLRCGVGFSEEGFCAAGEDEGVAACGVDFGDVGLVEEGEEGLCLDRGGEGDFGAEEAGAVDEFRCSFTDGGGSLFFFGSVAGCMVSFRRRRHDGESFQGSS